MPLGGDQEIGRVNRFSNPTWLLGPGGVRFRVSAWKWTVRVTSSTDVIEVGDGIGGLTAELVLRTVDGGIRRMFTNEQIGSLTLGP